MVSFNVYRATSSGAYVEGVCLATDEKPITGIANGSILYAVDASDGTTTRYMFDQSTASWIEAECPCSGGEGGGSGSGGGGMAIHMSEAGILDKTWQEIYDAVSNGIIPVLLEQDKSSFAVYLCSAGGGSEGEYGVQFNALGDSVSVEAGTDNANGYPDTNYYNSSPPSGPLIG